MTGEPSARGGAPPAVTPAAAKTYTVKTGDTLSGIPKAHLGNAAAYMRIFELNKDQLTDPDKIGAGTIAGAIVGGILGGGSGAAKSAAIGGRHGPVSCLRHAAKR